MRGAVEDAPPPPPGGAHSLDQAVKDAADAATRALDSTGQVLEKAVETASDKAFQSAADVGVNIATPAAQAAADSAFSWSGYIQAMGILCLLLAALWCAVWLVRRYGKFNFLPRPGALPRDALVMEAQMPLGPKKGLMVVRFLNRRLLLGVTEHQISLLTEDTARDERQAKNFQGFLDDANDADSSSRTNNIST